MMKAVMSKIIVIRWFGGSNDEEEKMMVEVIKWYRWPCWWWQWLWWWSWGLSDGGKDGNDGDDGVMLIVMEEYTDSAGDNGGDDDC